MAKSAYTLAKRYAGYVSWSATENLFGLSRCSWQFVCKLSVDRYCLIIGVSLFCGRWSLLILGEHLFCLRVFCSVGYIGLDGLVTA